MGHVLWVRIVQLHFVTYIPHGAHSLPENQSKAVWSQWDPGWAMQTAGWPNLRSLYCNRSSRGDGGGDSRGYLIVKVWHAQPLTLCKRPPAVAHFQTFHKHPFPSSAVSPHANTWAVFIL